MDIRVDDILSASPRTKRLGSLSLGRGRQLAIWRNSHDNIKYNAIKDHVFSLYLNGGRGTRRIDGGMRVGEPGTLCFFPEGHSSEWQITEAFEFMHLYVSDDILRSAFANIHDQDARRLDVTEQIFAAPGQLEQPLRKMAQAVWEGDVLTADIGFSEMVAALSDKPIHLSGGLSRKALRNITEWVDTHLENEIRLNDLAKLAGLSEFHFHRMFSQAYGVSPHSWVMQHRIMRAKKMLTKLPMAQVALTCGFSSQSHFIRRFKQHMGVTPGQYLQMT